MKLNHENLSSHCGLQHPSVFEIFDREKAQKIIVANRLQILNHGRGAAKRCDTFQFKGRFPKAVHLNLASEGDQEIARSGDYVVAKNEGLYLLISLVDLGLKLVFR